MRLMASATITRKRVTWHLDKAALARLGVSRVLAIAKSDVEAVAHRGGFAVLEVEARIATEWDLAEDPSIAPRLPDMVTVLVDARLIDA